jgi:plastocyanin
MPTKSRTRQSTYLRRALLAAVAALAVSVVAPPGAQADTHVYTYRSGPYTMGGFEVKRPREFVRTPQKAGYVTRMYARLVYKSGKLVPIKRVMLHHVVFLNAGRFRGDRHSSCAGRSGQPFYGTGEEKERLILPNGYGYHVGAKDRWFMQTMLMSHNLATEHVYVQYRFTFVRNRPMTPVTPFWVRANGCTTEPSYDIQGGGAPGSTHFKTYNWRVPLSGRIVAAGSHIHGGSKGVFLTQPNCGDRTILSSKPLYGYTNDPVYHVFPVLHEPGPISSTWYESHDGIPITKGEVLRITGAYDGEYPHPRVMAIMHVYVAPAAAAPPPCATLPIYREFFLRAGGRTDPPHTVVPLTALNNNGHLQTILAPPGKVTLLNGSTNVAVRDFNYDKPNLSVPAGATITWRFYDPDEHNVLLADGPRNVASLLLRRGGVFAKKFDVPGTYRLFCMLHPVTMHEVVDVRPAPGRAQPQTTTGEQPPA